jgi:hypothetical protein
MMLDLIVLQAGWNSVMLVAAAPQLTRGPAAGQCTCKDMQHTAKRTFLHHAAALPYLHPTILPNSSIQASQRADS